MAEGDGRAYRYRKLRSSCCYTAKPYDPNMFSFIETRLFARLLPEYLSDDEYARLQRKLMQDPEAGAVIRGSGGIRKLRWAAAGRGKRSGYRVIYFVRRPKGVIWMRTIHPKNVSDTIPARVLKQVREEIDDD